MIIKGYIFSILYAIICLAFAFILYKNGVAKKTTRKVVHILVGFEWVILNHFFFDRRIHFLTVCIIFLLILALSYRKKLLPMISSDGDNSPGTVYYAVAMSVMALITLFIPSMMLPFGIGVFCTSLGDGFAGLIGQSISPKVNKRIYQNKTIFGTIASFVFSLIPILIFRHIFEIKLSVICCIVIAAFATELELFVGRGLDNIAVTLGTAFLSFLLINYQQTLNYIVPIILTPLIIVFSLKKNALTVSGVLAAILLDVVVSVCLKNKGFILLLAFFAIGVLVDKVKKRYNKAEQNIEKRGSKRDAVQVFANGLVPMFCAIIYFVTTDKIFAICYVAALAEALADTASSGIGVFSKFTFDPFRMKKCEKGISGGMSILGTVASLLGAIIIAIIALAMKFISFSEALMVVLAGFLGAFFDSFIGSILQVKYKCMICGKITEREEHCSTPSLPYSGIKFITNDTVNLCGTLFAASFVIFLLMIV